MATCLESCEPCCCQLCFCAGAHVLRCGGRHRYNSPRSCLSDGGTRILGHSCKASQMCSEGHVPARKFSGCSSAMLLLLWTLPVDLQWPPQDRLRKCSLSHPGSRTPPPAQSTPGSAEHHPCAPDSFHCCGRHPQSKTLLTRTNHLRCSHPIRLLCSVCIDFLYQVQLLCWHVLPGPKIAPQRDSRNLHQKCL